MCDQASVSPKSSQLMPSLNLRLIYRLNSCHGRPSTPEKVRQMHIVLAATLFPAELVTDSQPVSRICLLPPNPWRQKLPVRSPGTRRRDQPSVILARVSSETRLRIKCFEQLRYMFGKLFCATLRTIFCVVCCRVFGRTWAPEEF
jgi:hypothetical protein